jgi:hypothetical protein
MGYTRIGATAFCCYFVTSHNLTYVMRAIGLDSTCELLKNPDGHQIVQLSKYLALTNRGTVYCFTGDFPFPRAFKKVDGLPVVIPAVYITDTTILLENGDLYVSSRYDDLENSLSHVGPGGFVKVECLSHPVVAASEVCNIYAVILQDGSVHYRKDICSIPAPGRCPQKEIAFTPITGLPPKVNAIAISLSMRIKLILLENGDLYASTSLNESFTKVRDLPSEEKVIAISALLSHSLILLESGRVVEMMSDRSSKSHNFTPVMGLLFWSSKNGHFI